MAIGDNLIHRLFYCISHDPNLSSLPNFIAPAASHVLVSWDTGVLVQSELYEFFNIPTPPNNETAQYALTSGTFTAP